MKCPVMKKVGTVANAASLPFYCSVHGRYFAKRTAGRSVCSNFLFR